MVWVCTYCGTEASNDVAERTGCCGEVHYDEIKECPKCGSLETIDAHHEGNALAPECTYTECQECGHQWNFN